MKKYLINNPSIKEIIFFSTWCSDCKDKILLLKNDYFANKKYVLINIFDTQERAENVIKNMNINIPCFHDVNKTISKEYNVSFVPYEISTKNQSFR